MQGGFPCHPGHSTTESGEGPSWAADLGNKPGDRGYTDEETRLKESRSELPACSAALLTHQNTSAGARRAHPASRLSCEHTGEKIKSQKEDWEGGLSGHINSSPYIFIH